MAEETIKVATKPSGALMSALDGLGELPWLRQVGLMVGLAASVAIGFGVVLWSQEPNFQPLLSDITTLEASELSEALQRENIQFKVDTSNGMVLVRADKIDEARLLLAREGFPTGNTMGYELLDKEQGFGTSQFMEKTRYFRSIEGELAKTISSLTPVRNARVHLAIPKRSVFINDKRKPSASVFLELYPSRNLEKDQVAAIVHLVASSVPEMSSKDVTVVDQRGRLLSETGDSTEIAYAAKQLDYQRNVEQEYITRVRDLLEPLVGSENFKVQVTADIDFNVVEQTAELYNPDLPALRSEQTLNEKSSTAGAFGIPGALSNQPPGAATVPEKTTGGANASGNTGATDASGNQRQQATRNYELDRTISHTRRQVGAIKRLSVAVVLDDKWQNPAPGSAPGTQPVQISLSEAELERITLLVKDAVGFSASRGDSVSVINQAFHPEQIEAIPELPIWQQAWFTELARQGAGLLVVIILIFGVLRPILRGLAVSKKEESVDSLESALASVGADGMLGAGGYDGADVTFAGGASNPLLPGPDASFEQHIDAIKALVAEDPRRVAQVVKNWIETGA